MNRRRAAPTPAPRVCHAASRRLLLGSQGRTDVVHGLEKGLVPLAAELLLMLADLKSGVPHDVSNLRALGGSKAELAIHPGHDRFARQPQ